MITYKIQYWDKDGGGTTLIKSPDPLDVEEASELIQEQLLANDISTSPVQVETFREVKNPFDHAVANLQRYGIG
ncbi:MAG: hypothetical protein RM049_13525 [Nostoc sp. DedQUE04]|uniref:hypothetical protein n=1 Tax=Nostoc sp. DedQUE04 TaxID=3075390 RepID=UPI002AD59B05|nr:hypothetical protein [Nostoc sp. DedQUE04]MDZ8136307.1 hypothetical protein [Nostoc sp. DedQUE04]